MEEGEPEGMKEDWGPGDEAYFEYLAWESPDSVAADMWQRSHQAAVVLGRGDDDALDAPLLERLAEGQPRVYRVRFPDGHEGHAFEDELLTGPRWFTRPSPPASPGQPASRPPATAHGRGAGKPGPARAGGRDHQSGPGRRGR